MSENRRQVLQMLAAGQITADEAERLIAALEKDSPNGTSANGSVGRSNARKRSTCVSWSNPRMVMIRGR